MKRYTLSVTSPEYWSEIHNALIVDSNQDGIPDRQVTCTDSKNHSPTRGTYELTEDEVAEIASHPHVKWIELSPTDNPEAYPDPSPATKRFRGNVKIYRDLDGNGPPSTNPTSAELYRTNWALKRVGINSNAVSWPNVNGAAAVINNDVSYSLTGKNVDIVIHDSGILQYHPEFMINGQSRVSDIVLDGPYYIDPDYFISNNYTYTKPDGRTGITTASAEGWWENSSNRSAAFQSEGTVAIPAAYNAVHAVGDSLDGSNGMVSGHGTACAGIAAGKYMGLAFESNIWSMPAISDAVDMGIEASYDLIKIWHRNKPTNTATGRKNPTIVNGSWGHNAAFYSNSNVSYRFRGTTGSFTGNVATSNIVTAMKNGLGNSVNGAFKSWSTSSRSNSTDTAADEMMAEGVIYVAAAGNNRQRLGIGANDPDRLNYMTDAFFGSTDPRSEFPTGTVPCNHRDWMNPQGIGFDSATDFHPVICVGSIHDQTFLFNGILHEYKSSISNTGPGIDVWAPGVRVLAPGTNNVSGYTNYVRYDDSRFYDCEFGGTSAAAPVVTGLIALYLETNPTATSRQVKEWLNTRGCLEFDFFDRNTDDTQTDYWLDSFNLKGAPKKLIHDETANDIVPKITGVNISGISFKQS